jgi:hypothetical protein
MSIVTLTDRYRANVEESNLSLQRKAGYKNKEGKDVWESCSHHGDWERLFDALLRRLVKDKLDIKGIVACVELKTIYQEAMAEIRRMTAFERMDKKE